MINDPYANGTFQILKTFFENNIAGSEIIFVILILTVFVLMLASTRISPKFIFIFMIVALTGFFGNKALEGSGTYLSGSYGWVILFVIIIAFTFILLTIYDYFIR